MNAAIKAKTEELKRNGQAGTYRSYHALLTAVEEFAGKDIPFSAVTVDWLNRCGRFWTGQKKSKSTLSVYFKMLKAIMNRAKADGIIKEAHFPFGRNRFEIPSAEGRKLALTLEQIKRLVTYTDGREETELYRDMWFFSYLCNGINFRDMLYLTYGNIIGDEICFATVLKRSGTNISYISESLGHSNLAITENYLASFERDERMKNAQLLTKFD